LAVSNERRANAQRTFSGFAPKILTILHSYLLSTGTNRELQNKVLMCLLSWVRQGGIEPNSMPASEIFKSTWEALKVPELFEVPIPHHTTNLHCINLSSCINVYM
jgi:hypothetical protein